MSDLCKWACIDIETTGINPEVDQIIDIGFYAFSGIELVKKYSSLVYLDGPIPPFITKLTGITARQLNSAPSLGKIKNELNILDDNLLIAHNASFEQGFLSPHFSSWKISATFCDSLPFLALLYPERSHLSLESILVDLGIREKEEHRGLSDSLDLLSVLLYALYDLQQNAKKKFFFMQLTDQYFSKNDWFTPFLNLNSVELLTLAKTLDLNLEEIFHKNKNNLQKKKASTHFTPKFSGENMKQILQDEKEMQKIQPNYQYRSSQEEMSLRVGQSFKNGIHSLIQAPTGTGKTLGYLLPAIAFSLSEKKTVLISTGTKVLQQQIVKKDFSQTCEIFNLDNLSLPWTNLVGMNNHFCELIFRNLTQENDSNGLFGQMKKFEERLSFAFFEHLFFHHQNQQEFIVVDSIPHVLKKNFETFKQLADELKIEQNSCVGHKCPFKNNCSYFQTILKAKESSVIVANHALMLRWPKSFPRPEYIIVDEAHKLEKDATEVYSVKITSDYLSSFVQSLEKMQGIGALIYLKTKSLENSSNSPLAHAYIEGRNQLLELSKRAQEIRQLLDILVVSCFENFYNFSDLYWNELPFLKERSDLPLKETKVVDCLESFLQIIVQMQELVEKVFGEKLNKDSFSDEKDLVALNLAENFINSLDETISMGNKFLALSSVNANSLKYHVEEGYQFCSYPIDVGNEIHLNLLSSSQSVVFTTATMPNPWTLGYDYLDPKKRFKNPLNLQSPFNYQDNAQVFLCDDVGELYDKNFVSKLILSVLPLITKMEGRTLILFSSRDRFEKARDLLVEKLEGGIPLFIQGMGYSVVEEFKKSGRGILLGLESFGEGVDIPGHMLEFLIIDKIPDLRRDHVIEMRRKYFETHYGQEFLGYFMAERTRLLHQKLGRLLRTPTDRGAAIIVDSRIKKWKNSTIEAFSSLMQPYVIQRKPIDEAVGLAEQFIIAEGEK